MRAVTARLMLGALLTFSLCANAETQKADSEKATIDPAVCAACHGSDGNSMNPEWPSLAGQNQRYIMEQLWNYKEGRRENALMSAQAMPLTEADIKHLAAYYSSQDIKIPSISADDVQPGESLYRGGDAAAGIPACMSCHGPNGAGNAAAGYPALRGQKVAYTISTLKAYRDGSRQSSEKYQQMMNTIAKRMSDAQIEAIANYVSGLY